MPRRQFGGGARGVKPPQRQISNQAITGDIDGIIPVAGIVKAGGSVGLGTAEGALTIVRTRGQLMAMQRVEAGADQIIRGALGIILVSQDAFDVGITALPGPISDSLSDWYVWAPFTLMSFVGVELGDQALMVRVDFDSRGMRKAKFGEVSAVVVELESDVAGGSVDIGYVFREQVKL